MILPSAPLKLVGEAITIITGESMKSIFLYSI